MNFLSIQNIDQGRKFTISFTYMRTYVLHTGENANLGICGAVTRQNWQILATLSDWYGISHHKLRW